MPYGKRKPMKFRKLNVGDTFNFPYDEDSLFVKVSANRYKVSKGGGSKTLINRNELVVRQKAKIQLIDTEISDWRKNGILLRKV